MEEFIPEVTLEYGERAELATIISHPGFKIIDKIMKSVVAKFGVAMLNAPEGSPEVYERHRSAKVAAQIYDGLINIINHEVQQYVGAPKASDKPVDPTSILDMEQYGDDFEKNSYYNEGD